ncbi:helix-turn-helix transcriptional regulator [Mucilaginibacter sp. Bleaf8]|uniref:helix-turn-helix transcriptional regulator n=1 Tax=Mucilaginibacter sp. Bleaf8 TaxID=2834430 RepID=UPI001BCDA6FA|nr:AraC family transcriptional regulator [Mucilaginibacter sp. Bleaf8]MBS7564788.1 helix-turn-helix transcriptional regulator [Mucilaginibacter sp. Bleaf8]
MNYQGKGYADNNIQRFTNKLGVILEDILQYFQVIFFKGFTFLPDMAMHFGSFLVTDDFTRVTGQSDIADGIGFVFYNIFESNVQDGTGKGKNNGPMEPPYVRIFPYAISQTLHFKKNTRVSHVSISISAAYLKDFLKEEAEHFEYLFDSANNFWIEELMTDDILRTVNDIVKKEEPGTMKSFYYKMKAMELLFYLFESMKKRENASGLKLNGKDIQAVYQVRDKIVSSLSRPSTITELKQIAGMNELKLRKIFTQVFGMGIYDYYQHLRMQEAARLLREEHLSVSEAGYQMGFENLGHFTRVFEKHIGKKPKKYMQSFNITRLSTKLKR